jgi:predicted DNA-binding transcriptional regulator YafY
MPKRYSGTLAAHPDGRTEKILRVLNVLSEKGIAPDQHRVGADVLSRQRLAELSDVTMRNLDAIIASLRQQGYGIGYEDSTGYYLLNDQRTSLPRLRAPDHYQSLRSLRRYLERSGTTIDHDRWLDLIDQLIHSSEEGRRRTMGRGFSEARVDEQGVVFKIDEPMVFYLNVHRAAPDPLTKAHISRIKDAIRQNSPVRMKYVNRAGVRDTVTVEPYFIFEREGTYYLAGLQVADQNGPLKRNRFKPFTLTRVRCPSLDLLPDRHFVPKRTYSAEQCLSITGISNAKDNDRVTAEVDIFGRFAYNVCEVLHGEESSCTWISTEPGSQQVRVRATFGSRYDLIRFVLSFGGHALLLSPADVCEMIRDNITEMAARYNVELPKHDLS